METATLAQHASETAEAFSRRVAMARERLPEGRLLVTLNSPQAVAPASGVCAIDVPAIFVPFLTQPARYRVSYGSRGRSGDWTFVRALLFRCLARPELVLCCGEHMHGISDSVHHLLCDQISRLCLDRHFTVEQQSIYAKNGSAIMFAGIRTHSAFVSSLEAATICYIEEGQDISEKSWAIVSQTIRRPGSEIWLSFNPAYPGDPMFRNFVTTRPASSVICRSAYLDNLFRLSEHSDAKRRVS